MRLRAFSKERALFAENALFSKEDRAFLHDKKHSQLLYSKHTAAQCEPAQGISAPIRSVSRNDREMISKFGYKFSRVSGMSASSSLPYD